MTQRIALVTGGGRGLGKNAALKLANKGIGIVLTWNSNEKEAQQVVDEIRQSGGKAAALPLNVGDISTFPSFVEQMKHTLKAQWQSEGFDYLLNNAGIGITAPYSAFTEAQFDQLLSIQFKGAIFPDAESSSADEQGGKDPQCLDRPGAFCSTGLQRLCRHERGDGSAYPVSG